MNFSSKMAAWAILVLFVVGAAHANMVVTPWIPIFKGIERAAGTNFPSTTIINNGISYTDSTLQAANCLRIDLTDPDVQLFPTPRATNYIAESTETHTISISNFVKRYGVRVATAANFYTTSVGTDPSTEGIPSRVFGLSISTGQVVSVPDFGPDSNNRYASMLFTTNKAAFLVLNNAPPGTNTDGIYTAVSGYYAVLTNGVIVGGSSLSQTFPDSSFHNLQPRTVFGLSADRRYFYMMIIDGRQPGYSQGANDDDMGIWLVQFGASDGIAMDGGGSTAMYVADCAGGNPKPLGRSSYVAGTGRERITGSQLGVHALPLPDFINNVTAIPGSLTATITWTTLSNATTQVAYGTTTNYGTLSPLDSTPVTNHSVTLNNLVPATRYYFRALSVAGGNQFSSGCGTFSFTTTNFAGGVVFPLTQNWKFQTNNFDGVNWQTPGFNDNGWSNGPAPVWADSRNPVPANAIPNFATGTRMPINSSTTYPFSTYYLRTHFTYSHSLAGLVLTFSNYVDDGAVFYLNGFEIHRTNMPAGSITNGTFTPAGALCPDGNASCPLVFNLTGDALSNFVVGTNMMAVELHNFRSLSSGIPSPDATFEMGLHYALPPPVQVPPFISNVDVSSGETNAVITWTTLSNSTSQVWYGVTPALGSSNTLDSNLVANHAMMLTGLQPVTPYHFRIVSTFGTNRHTYDGSFSTEAFHVPVVTFSNSWRFTTNNLDGMNWMAPSYDDSGWLGEGPALLYIEDNVGVSPRNTPLPNGDNGSPYPTYYFRTHFTFSGPTAGFALLFTNFIDDAAVFYLNGVEIQRVRMATGPVAYTNVSSDCPPNNCETTVDVPDVFRVGGDAMTNLVVGGDNVLAAEVHQHAGVSSDIVFGSEVAVVRALASETKLRISRTNNVVCISWDGNGLTLQSANVLSGSNPWTDVPGPITAGPYCTTNPPTSSFYRLRN